MDIRHRSVLVLFLCIFLLFSLAQAQQTERTTVNLPRGQLANFPFSDAVRIGNTLYISGRIGLDVNTMKVPADPKEEVKLLLDAYSAVLAKAEMTMDNLVSVTVYCPDLTLYSTFNDVYRTYFKKDLPARAFVGSGPLLFGGRFEMQAIAVK